MGVGARALKQRVASKLANFLTRNVRAAVEYDREAVAQVGQLALVNQYRQAALLGRPLHRRISDAGFRQYSQFEEDGIILYVLATIGMTTRKVVEIGIGRGDECMAANLILNHGFEAYLFEGDEADAAAARKFFEARKDCLLNRPNIRSAWITQENINDLLTEAGAMGEVDLLSIDIDGNDYYIWKAIEVLRPRLCVFETNDYIPSDRSLTIPYDPKFFCWDKPGAEADFRSVSLRAMQKLSERKGYRLIGAHRHGFNAFFLRDDIAREFFPAVTVEEVHDNAWTRSGQKERWPVVAHMPWVEVEA